MREEIRGFVLIFLNNRRKHWRLLLDTECCLDHIFVTSHIVLVKKKTLVSMLLLLLLLAHQRDVGVDGDFKCRSP
jgi:hypothetical protein